MSGIHAAARAGFAAEAAAYARGRPDYPQALRSWLVSELGLGPARVVVDLGAGTGKFTPLLLGSGARVMAVEPIAPMRERLAAGLPMVEVIDGRAEAMPLESGSVDAVVCAQAFHWFANDAALAEIHRVLRPGGRLGLVWNVRDESVDWVAAITRIIAPYEGDAPRFRTGEWRRPFRRSEPSGPDPAHPAGFSEPRLSLFPHVHEGSVDAVIVDRIMSVSFIAALPAAERTRVEAALRELAATHPALRGRERLAFPYSTRAYRCDRD